MFCFVVLYVSKQRKKFSFTVYLRKGKKYEKKLKVVGSFVKQSMFLMTCNYAKDM